MCAVSKHTFQRGFLEIREPRHDCVSQAHPMGERNASRDIQRDRNTVVDPPESQIHRRCKHPERGDCPFISHRLSPFGTLLGNPNRVESVCLVNRACFSRSPLGKCKDRIVGEQRCHHWNSRSSSTIQCAHFAQFNPIQATTHTAQPSKPPHSYLHRNLHQLVTS